MLVEKSGVPMIGIISADEFQRVIAEQEARFEVVDRIRRRCRASLTPRSNGTWARP